MADPRDFTVVFPIILRLSKVHVFRTAGWFYFAAATMILRNPQSPLTYHDPPVPGRILHVRSLFG